MNLFLLSSKKLIDKSLNYIGVSRLDGKHIYEVLSGSYNNMVSRGEIDIHMCPWYYDKLIDKS